MRYEKVYWMTKKKTITQFNLKLVSNNCTNLHAFISARRDSKSN